MPTEVRRRFRLKAIICSGVAIAQLPDMLQFIDNLKIRLPLLYIYLFYIYLFYIYLFYIYTAG